MELSVLKIFAVRIFRVACVELGKRLFYQRVAAIVDKQIEDDERCRGWFAEFVDAAGGGMNAHQQVVEGERLPTRE